MVRFTFLGAIALGVLLVAGCETRPRGDAPLSQVSVRYDPYDFSIADIRNSAEAECRAKGGNYIEESGNTPNLESPRWAYKTFNCFR
jgi:hypothetical protein